MAARNRSRGLHSFPGLRIAAITFLVGGGCAVSVALASQQHAPQPSRRVAGTTGAAEAGGSSTRHRTVRSGGSPKATRAGSRPGVVEPTLPRSVPVAIDIPAIGVSSDLQALGLAPTGAIAVPAPGPDYNEAAWYDGSPTPGEAGPSVIEGHIDSAATGPSVFFRLGALAPGDTANVTLADGTVAVFTVTGVRQYPKASFPSGVVYGNTNFAALRLITCGGQFDSTTGHYLANTVVFASLTSSHFGSTTSAGGLPAPTGG